MYFEIERDIAASPHKLWSVLIDAPTLADGTFGIDKIEGEIAPGARLRVWSHAAPDRAFALRVVRFVKDREMVWTGGMPLGLFTGTRVFTLTPINQGTRFKMREDYSGPMVGLIGKSMPDLNPSFRQFADGLARAAEEL